MRLILAASLLLFPALVVSQDKCVPPDDKQIPPPVIPKIDGEYEDIFEMWTEIKQTGILQDPLLVLVRERHDGPAKLSQITFISNDESRSEINLLVSVADKKLYSYTSTSCSGYSWDEVNDGKLFSEWGKWAKWLRWLKIDSIDTVTNATYGPSHVFWEANYYSNSESFRGEWGKCAGCDGSVIRNIQTDHWIDCHPTQGRRDFYYTDQKWQFDGTTSDHSVPIRYTTLGLVMDVISMDYKQKSLKLTIPSGLGCPGLEKTPLPQMDQFELSAEMIFKSTELAKIYVSDLNVMKEDGYYSYTYTPWVGKDENRTDFSYARQQQHIFDTEQGIKYILQDDIVGRPVCTFSQQPTNLPVVVLPKYGELNIESVFMYPDIEFQKLGKSRSRDYPSVVYERTVKNFNLADVTVGTMVITHHYTDEDFSIGDNFDVEGTVTEPLSIEIRAYDAADNRGKPMKKGLLFTVILNVNDVSLRPQKLHKKLNVFDCYDATDDSKFKWFQVGFNVVQQDMFLAVQGEQHQIMEAYLQALYNRVDGEGKLRPMRVPEVSVDFEEQTVFINTLLLERPLIQENFDVKAVSDIVTPTETPGIMTLDSCLLKCLKEKHRCQAASYCGSVCSFTSESNVLAPGKNKEDQACNIYMRKAGSESQMPTTDSVISSLQRAVESKADKFTFDIILQDADQKKNFVITFEADSFDDTKDFESAFHFQKNQDPILATSFKLDKIRMKYKGPESSDSSDRTLLASLPQSDCAQACENREDCESFSFCDKNQECIISTQHTVNEKTTKEDNYCVIYTKKYLDRFERFPGITLETKAEHQTTAEDEDSCAQKCINSKDFSCRSFDYCPLTKDCNLNTEHISESGKTKAPTTENSMCAHYSKEYTYDYTKKIKTSGVGKFMTAIFNITERQCAKECSEWVGEKTCLSYDFCASSSSDAKGDCQLRSTNQKETIAAQKCSFSYFSGRPAKKVVAHSGGAAAGLSLLMLLIGIGLGAGILIGYNHYKAAH